MKYLIIDGSNLVRKIYGFNPEEAKKDGYRTDTRNSAAFVSIMRRFLRRCRKFAALRMRPGHAVEVYFDGKPRNIGADGGVEVDCICSGYASADERILERLNSLPRAERRKALLLTFDNPLLAQARGLGAHVIDPSEIIRKIGQSGLDLYAYV